MKKLIRIIENMDSLKKIIKENAPHGSGINYNYKNIRVEHYSKTNENKIIFENAYDNMTDYGFYDVTLHFRIVIGSSLTPSLHFLGLSSAEWNKVKKYGLREYLEDIFNDWVNNDDELLEILIRIL